MTQTTAFYWATRANSWARGFVPSRNGAATALDGMRVFVNAAGLECNAFSDGSSITTGRAGGPCANTAAEQEAKLITVTAGGDGVVDKDETAYDRRA